LALITVLPVTNVRFFMNGNASQYIAVIPDFLLTLQTYITKLASVMAMAGLTCAMFF
jgi:hypothetical protein